MSNGDKKMELFTYIDEAKVREELAELAKARIVSNPFASKPDHTKDPVTVSLNMGLACATLMMSYGQLDADERRKLVDRINVLLRAHPPMALPLQVKE